MIQIGETKKATASQRYVGFALMKVVGINPTDEELEKILGREVTWENSYTMQKDGVDMARFDFWLAPVDETITMKPVKYSVFLHRSTMKSKTGKTKVIDKYGNTAWVTAEEFSGQQVPKSSSGKPLAIMTPYEVCCKGQDLLVEFVKAWLSIPFSFSWDKDSSSFIAKKDEALSRCECKLENIKSYWSGDMSEIKSLLDAGKDHIINVLLTVRQANINNAVIDIQDVFPYFTPGWQDTFAIKKEFERRKAQGGFANITTILEQAKPFIPTPKVLPTQQADNSFFGEQVEDTTYVVTQADKDELPF